MMIIGRFSKYTRVHNMKSCHMTHELRNHDTEFSRHNFLDTKFEMRIFNIKVKLITKLRHRNMLLHETLDDYWTNYTNTLTTRSIYTARVDIEYTRFRDSSQIHGTFLNMDTNLTQLSRQMCALYTRFCTLISHTLDDYRTFLNKQLCHILYRLCEFSTKLRHDIAHI